MKIISMTNVIVWHTPKQVTCPPGTQILDISGPHEFSSAYFYNPKTMNVLTVTVNILKYILEGNVLCSKII